MRRVLTKLASATAIAALVSQIPGTAVAAKDAQLDEALIQSKLRADLGEVLAQTEPGDLVPITVIMREQVPREVIQSARNIENKAVRRAYVINTLKLAAAESQADLLQVLRQQALAGQVESLNPMWIHNLVAARVTPETARLVALREDVAYLNYDRPAGVEIFPAVPGEAIDTSVPAIECGVVNMRAPEVWSEFSITGEGVVVGVIDTGMCLTHPDIVNQIWTNPGEIPNNGVDDDNNGYIDDVNGWNFENNNNNVNDSYGHGSHVSGTVAGDGTQGQQSGMAPDAQIMVLKFWNSFSGEQTVWDGMEYGTENGADILTASLGWPHSLSPDRVTWRTICENSMAAGVVVTYAAHNYGCSNPPDDVTTPGDVPDMITVGAVDCNDVKAGFSSCGPSTWEGIFPWNDWPYPPGKLKPTIAAGGVNTLSHSFCSGYTTMSGTSMATPHVAGAMALMLQANPNLDHWQCKQILKDTAVDLGPPGPDNQLGHGRVDAYEAVVVAMSTGSLQLRMDGPCPGQMTVTAGGANEGDRIAFGYGFVPGTGRTIPGCEGLRVDVVDGQLVTIVTANSNGEATLLADVPNAACNRIYVQAVNLDGCTKSNVVQP